jgi:hypothetical protein
MTDSLAAAIDWLDAYRGRSLDLVDMYVSDAFIDCECEADRVVGAAAIEGYWRDRLENRPALELVDMHPVVEDVVEITYNTRSGIVRALLGFDDGKIAWQKCGLVSAKG